MADVTLTNTHINTLKQTADMVAKFPFLSLGMSQKTGCCHKGRFTPDYDGIRRAIIALPPDKQAEFKKALNAHKLFVDVREDSRAKRVEI